VAGAAGIRPPLSRGSKRNYNASIFCRAAPAPAAPPACAAAMLTGHNTELLHDQVAFHVQTEDKGLGNPQVVSLIYVGGRVLAAKRTSYADLLAQGSGEKDIADLMERQHRTMLAAIRHGRFDDHVRQLLDQPAAGAAVGTAAEPHGNHSLEDLSQSLDEMVSEFLGADPGARLSLTVGTGTPPRAGEVTELSVQAIAMPAARAVVGAEVRVEMISPFAPALLLASGATDQGGRWVERVELPGSVGGLGVLIVSVRSAVGDAEEKILL